MPIQTAATIGRYSLIANLASVAGSLSIAAAAHFSLGQRLWLTLLAGGAAGAALSFATAWLASSRAGAAIHAIAESITQTAHSIAATVEQRERLASQQASAASETTAAMEELAASARHSAEQAESLAVGAQQVVSLAGEGSSGVRQSLKGMEGLKEKVHTIAERILQLSEQASQIGSITNLVTDVASQTNMLALNAAVEASRAGEHGKGFSVVAVEIRKLADQTKRSAEKISLLVNDILKAINSTVLATEEGTKTVDQSAVIAGRTVQTFAGVTEAIGRASENTQQISLNAKQQSLAVNEVLRAMNDLSHGVRETVTSISQGKARAEVLLAAADRVRALA